MKRYFFLTLCASFVAGAFIDIEGACVVSDNVVEAGIEDYQTRQLDSSSICASSRAGFHTPVAFETMSENELRSVAAATSLPQNLSLLPSVVSVSECGTGVGYTSLSIRGISAFHTNVTLNGISLGDSESQQVFWVNIPSLSNILSSVQMQRGLGTAACGPGAFGASINMLTLAPSLAGGSLSGGYGSYNTWSVAARGSSGILGNGFFIDAALNYNQTDGYIRNAPAYVWSAYANAGWKGRRDVVQVVFLQGWQQSAITWNGVPFDIYPVDRRYNVSEGDTDNFRQTHVQLNEVHNFSAALSWNNTLNYTHGYGWYDISGLKDYLKNDLWVLRSELKWHLPALDFSALAYLSTYKGKHWNEYYPSEQLYSNDAVKSEIDLSARAEWTPVSPLTVFAEVQYRGIRYTMYDVLRTWNFCNPRIGLNYSPSGQHKLYAFVAMGHREPARADLESNTEAKKEMMLDYELGYKFYSPIVSACVNLYDMEYYDMLLETGLLDYQGYAIKSNVSRAYRRGVEVELALNPCRWFRFDGNCTWSLNRISALSEPTADIAVGNTLLLSPSWIGMLAASFYPWKGCSLSWTTKFVSEQYYDNTCRDSSRIPWYSVSDMNMSQCFTTKHCDINLGLWLNNVLNLQYYAYAYAYGVYPAAPRNWSVKLSFSFK